MCPCLKKKKNNNKSIHLLLIPNFLYFFYTWIVLYVNRSWGQCYICYIARAGYRSKIFDIDTDTLSSIPVPERYFFRYQFYEISLNKITLSQKILVSFFSACWHLYSLKDSSPEPLHKGTKYIQNNKSVQIILIKLK